MQRLQLPSGSRVHPWRLIVRDGHLMWKHALMDQGIPHLPTELAIEQHIIKTATRLEALAAWADHGDEDPLGFAIDTWYEDDAASDFNQGIRVLFTHRKLSPKECYDKLIDHLQPGEALGLIDERLLDFRRC